MKKAPPIFVVIILRRLKSLSLGLARNVVSRVGILRLGLIFLKAAWFQLQLSGIIGKPERLMVRSRDSGERTSNLACASVAKAELTAAAHQVEELWYEFRTTRNSNALESIQDVFAIALLSARIESFTIDLATTPSPPFADLELATLTGDETAERSASTASLMEFWNLIFHASILTKPFFQSEIAPNEYLKRVADGRKVVLISISDNQFRSCWYHLLGNIQHLTGEAAGGLFVLLDRTSIPSEPPLPAGIIVQPLDVLGFTNLERLALARNVDLLVTDHAPYILSALAKNPTIISPVLIESDRAARNGQQQDSLFKVSRSAEGGREIEELRYSAEDLKRPDRLKYGK